MNCRRLAIKMPVSTNNLFLLSDSIAVIDSETVELLSDM